MDASTGYLQYGMHAGLTYGAGLHEHHDEARFSDGSKSGSLHGQPIYDDVDGLMDDLQPSRCGRITKIVLAVLITATLRFIGITGLIHSPGGVALPGSLNWISSIGTIGHGFMVAGAGLGILASIRQVNAYRFERRNSSQFLTRHNDDTLARGNAASWPPYEAASDLLYDEAPGSSSSDIKWDFVNNPTLITSHQYMQQGEYAVGSGAPYGQEYIIAKNTYDQLIFCCVRAQDLQSVLSKNHLTRQFIPADSI